MYSAEQNFTVALYCRAKLHVKIFHLSMTPTFSNLGILLKIDIKIVGTFLSVRRIVSVMHKSAQFAQTVENSNSFFNVSYPWYKSLFFDFMVCNKYKENWEKKNFHCTVQRGDRASFIHSTCMMGEKIWIMIYGGVSLALLHEIWQDCKTVTGFKRGAAKKASQSEVGGKLHPS